MHEFAHIELPAIDTAKAGKFYGDLFGWTIQGMPGSDYLLFATDAGAMIGGIVRVDNIPYNETCLNYVEVEDLDVYTAKAQKLGGKLIRPRTALPPGMGAYSVIQSPDGYCLGIWEKGEFLP